MKSSFAEAESRSNNGSSFLADRSASTSRISTLTDYSSKKRHHLKGYHAKSMSAFRESTDLSSWQELRSDHKKICLSLDKRIALDSSISRVPEWIGVALAVLAGAFAIVQVGINTSLRKTMVPSALATSAFSFVVGLATITVISLMHKLPQQGWMDFFEFPWYAYSGGLLGAGFVTAAILLAPVLGFATFQLAAVAGQLVSGIICDSVGFLHLEPSKPTPWRMLNVSIVLAGTGLSAKWKGSDGTTTLELCMYLILAAVAGSVFPIQACVNHELAQHVGTPYRAVVINFLVGTFAMWATVLVESFLKDEALLKRRSDDGIDYSWWFWTGGAFGAILIAAVTMGIPSLGAVRFTAMFISTQLLCAVIADALGMFGYETVPLDAFQGRRIIGVSIAVFAAVGFKFSPPASWKWAREWSCVGWRTVDEECILPEEYFVPLPNSSFHVAVRVENIEAIYNDSTGTSTNSATETTAQPASDPENAVLKQQSVLTQSSLSIPRGEGSRHGS